MCCAAPDTSGSTSTGKRSRASGRGPLLQDGPSPLPGLSAKKSVLEGTAGLPRRSHPSHFAMGIKKKLLLKKIGTCAHFIILKREGSLFAPSHCSFPQGSTASFLAISFRVCLPGGVCLGGFNSCLTMMADEHVVPLLPTHGSFAPLIW